MSTEQGDDFAFVLKHFRNAAGLSQQALAQRARVSIQAVSALESGRRRAPYRNTVERLVAALDLDDGQRVAFTLAAERAREYGVAISAASGRIAGTVSPRNNLPRILTSFVGRDEVVAQIQQLVLSSPLVSIVGTGGVGKTRVAIHVGSQLLGHFRDGVWFVELASIADPALVAGAVASALHVAESTTRPVIETLAAALKKKKLLLILDNCEHVIDEARVVVAALLRECPDVCLLATSREALRVGGERTYRTPSLAVPPRGSLSAPQAVAYGAVALFADRALAADDRFIITDENATAVAEICRRLDGIPLAIELAAARIKALSPQQLARELDARFSLLTGGDATTLPRQQTMRALIDWSYELLSAQERALFARLSIFVGGFTLEAAVHVCAHNGSRENHVLEPLVSLVDKSLVLAETAAGDARYRLLESTRSYASEKLDERGERERLAERHGATYLQVAQKLEESWYTAGERAWIAQASLELDNWRAALEWSLGPHGDGGAIAQRLAGALSRVWYSLAAAEGRRWVHAALQTLRPDVPERVAAQLAIAEAELHGAFGQYRAALVAAERAVQVTERLGDPVATVRAQQSAGSALAGLGRGDEGEPRLSEALETARRLHNRRLVAMLLGELGTARSRRGDVAGARSYYAQALGNYEALGVERQAASVAGHLAEVEFAGGDAAAALLRVEEALKGHRAVGNDRSVANDLCNMTAYLVALERFDEARECAAAALNACRDVQAHVLTIWALQHLAAVEALGPAGDYAQAARLMGFVEARVTALEVVRDYTEEQEYVRIGVALDAALDTADVAAFKADGADWSEDRAVLEAVA